MLHRSYNFFNLVRNTNRYHVDQFYIFHIGLIKRNASILISKHGIQYKVHKLLNSQKIFINKKLGRNENWRWGCITRFSSDNSKTKKDSSEKILTESVQQRIIELNEEKLGKLKERVLNVKPVDSEEGEEKEKMAKLNGKQSTEYRGSPKEDAASKKGI